MKRYKQKGWKESHQITGFLEEDKNGEWVNLHELKPVVELLDELIETASYWSEYDVPLGLHDRIKQARELLD